MIVRRADFHSQRGQLGGIVDELGGKSGQDLRASSPNLLDARKEKRQKEQNVLDSEILVSYEIIGKGNDCSSIHRRAPNRVFGSS